MRYIVCFLIIASFISCNDIESTEIGEDLLQTNSRVYFIDTLTVNTSTIQFDSLIVSNQDRLLIGGYNDLIFGKTTSKSFVQLTNFVYDIEGDAIYDSISLVLNYDNYFYNDTIPIQRFKVFKVLEDIEPKEGDYYNTTSFEYNTTPLGIKDFLASPKNNDSLNIKLDNDFGLALFNKLKDNDINNETEFLDEYKGLLIEADNTVSTSVLGFSKNSSFLRLYYSIVDNDSEPVVNTIDLTFNSLNTFNQTLSDKTNTYFENIVNQETLISSSETDNSSFIQAGTGIVTRLDIPYIKSLYDISTQGIVVDAKLKFTLKDMYSDNLHTRDSLQAYIIDNKSTVITHLSFDGETPIKSYIEDENSEFDTDTYFLDVNPFIYLKQTETHEEYFLVIYPQEFNNSVDRYVFNDNLTSNDLSMKLELTYATYE